MVKEDRHNKRWTTTNAETAPSVRLAAQEAMRAAKEVEAAAKTECKALLADAYKTFKYKIKAYKPQRLAIDDRPTRAGAA